MGFATVLKICSFGSLGSILLTGKIAPFSARFEEKTSYSVGGLFDFCLTRIVLLKWREGSINGGEESEEIGISPGGYAVR